MRLLDRQSSGVLARRALTLRTADHGLRGVAHPSWGNAGAARPQGSLEIGLEAPPPHHELQAMWLELQARSQGSFFTSWTWVGPWLQSLPPVCRVRLLSARRDGRLLALALLVDKTDWRLGVVPIHATHLHATGRADCDGVTIEYNGLLVDRHAEPDLEAAVISQLMATDGAPDEFRLPGCSRLPQKLPTSLTLQYHEHPSFYVDLQAINASGDDYLGNLKPRSRHVVRKSLNRLSAIAPLRLVVAHSVPMAQQFMAELQRLHTAHWQSRGEPGAFSESFRRQFHARLIEQGVPEGRVVLLAMYQGDTPVAYFYYLCHGGWVHYYQSGVDYGRLDGSLSPGLAGHALAIEHFRAAGWRVYDFMAGEMQYKRTMCTDTTPLFWGTVQQRSAKMRMNNRAMAAGRLARAHWQKWLAPQKKGTDCARLMASASPGRGPENEMRNL
jgi:CelD/BcsL family acetyltransferase involved in cellulose biosynthesis